MSRRALPVALVLLLGCSPKAVPPTPKTEPVAKKPDPAPRPAPKPSPKPAAPTSGEESDTRERWEYDRGSVTKGTDGQWFETNPDTAGVPMKAWAFSETHRTKEYVELHDEKRGVSVRLTDSAFLAKWDKDGPTAEWKELYRGGWQR